jgi:hypothetical protein
LKPTVPLTLLQPEEDFKKRDQANLLWISVWVNSSKESSTETAEILPEQTKLLKMKQQKQQKQIKRQQKQMLRRLKMLPTQLKMRSLILGLKQSILENQLHRRKLTELPRKSSKSNWI